MDAVLSGILSSNHPDNLKKQLIQKIAMSGSQPQTVKQIKSVLELTSKWYLDSDSHVALAEGLSVFKSWAKYNLSTFEEFFNRDFVLHLLSTKFINESNAPILLEESLKMLQMSTHFSYHQKLIEAKAISYVREHPSIKCLTNFIHLLMEYKECIPKGEFQSRFCVSLIHALSISSAPDNPELVLQYVKDVEEVASMICYIWNSTDSDTVLDSLKAIFGIISSVDDFSPSFCLGAVTQYIPNEMINIVVKSAISDPNIDNSCMTSALYRIIDWLQWPTAKNIDQWIIGFLKGLASVKKFSILMNVTETKVEQVFEKLQFNAVRENAFNVLCHMLISFQHSPEPFHKIVRSIPDLVNAVKKENTTESQVFLSKLSDLIHCLVYLHAGFPDLYDPVLESIKEFHKPSLDDIKEKITQNKWASQKAEGSNYVVKVTQKSETGKTGLFNLGNTCYMNSIIQVLFMCDHFRRSILAHTPSVDEELIIKLQHVFSFLAQSQRPAYAPMNFLRHSRPPWFTSGHQQDCSEYLKYLLDQIHEQEKVVRKKKCLEDSTDQKRDETTMKDKQLESIIEENFGGEIETTVTCLNCNSVSSRSEHFNDIPLAFPEYGSTGEKSLAGGDGKQTGHEKMDISTSEANKTSETKEKEQATSETTKTQETTETNLHLDNLLKFYLKPEKMTGDNKYHCDKCEGLQDGERRIRITQAPQHLILTLLRFSYDVRLHSRSKIFREVKYPRTLILPTEQKSQSSQNKRHSLFTTISKQMKKCGYSDIERGEVYSLCSVVVHSGTSSECGHYYAYARHSVFCDTDVTCDILKDCVNEDDIDFLQDKWYLFNDNRVSYSSYSSFSNVTQRFTKDTAYVLIYKKIDPEIAESDGVDLNRSLHLSQIDPPLRSDLRTLVSKDNALYLQEQESQAKKKVNRKRPNTASWYNWQNPDSDDKGPPGNCGGGGGSGVGGLDTSGSRFIF